MSTPNLPIQNQNVIEIQVANGEKKKAYKPGFTGKDRGLMIATYGTFGKDYMTPDDAIQFADYAIADHEREIQALKKLKFKMMFEKYSKDIAELEQIVSLVKQKQREEEQEATETPFEE